MNIIVREELFKEFSKVFFKWMNTDLGYIPCRERYKE